MTFNKYLYETVKYIFRSPLFIRYYIKEVEKLYLMNTEDLEKRNEKRFLEIFRKAYDKSPFYHKLYSEAGINKEDVTCLADIKKLPVITKEMVKKHANEMLTVPHWMVFDAHTSGTTGSPLIVYENWSSIWWEQAYFYWQRKRTGFTYGQPFVSLRGNLDRRMLYMKIHISKTLYLSSYNINKDTVILYYRLITSHKPKAIEGYPSSLYSFALFLKEAGLKLHIPLVFTSSETLFDYQRKLIEEQLGSNIYDHYGMTERTILLFETSDHNGYFEAPGYSINEYLEDGEICTSLINDAFPMIRYRSNDVIEIEKNAEFNSKTVVKKVRGRVEDYICCNDGSRIMRLDFLFKGVRHVKMSQLIQDKTGKLSVCIVPESGFEDVDKDQIEKNLLNRIGVGNIDYCIKIISENDIYYTERRKFKYIINKMSVNNMGKMR